MAISEQVFEDAFQAYLDNSSWEETANVAMAKAFVTACRKLLAFPTVHSNNSTSTQFDRKTVENELLRARQFIASSSNGPANGMGGSRQFSFNEDCL